jgi:polysaccharide biosynthesis protein PslH
MSRKLQVLVLWRWLPTHYDASSSRMFHYFRNSAKYGHEITLVCYDDGEGGLKQIERLRTYGITIVLAHKPKRKILYTLREILLSPRLIRERVVPTRFYSREMQKTIDGLLDQRNFDVLYCDGPMIPYIVNSKRRKILDLVDPVLYSLYQLFLSEKNPLKKLHWLSGYYQAKMFAVPKYRNFDACVTVSPFVKTTLESYRAPNVSVIPYGIDTEYYTETRVEPVNNPVLIFTGAMQYVHNVKAVLWFHDEVFPLVKNQVPGAKLLIVGKQPAKEILQLAKDESVTVTGYVDDVRPYYAKSSLGIVPIITDDGGFKTKVLEAMAMNKPIVSTTLGAKGIDITSGKDIVIADGPTTFAQSVVSLLNDEQSREAIASNARRMVESKYSWETMTDKLAQLIENVTFPRQ